MHLLHSNISNLFIVCVLSYKIYCAYTPSNGAMALLNNISVFRILCVCMKHSEEEKPYYCVELEEDI